MDNIEFVTTLPRDINPDKPPFDATEKTKKYTGLAYAGRHLALPLASAILRNVISILVFWE